MRRATPGIIPPKVSSRRMVFKMEGRTLDDNWRKLLRMIGHELQQPMYTIQNLTLAAQQYLKLGQIDGATQMLVKIERQIARSRELGERLQQYASQQPQAATAPIVIDDAIDQCQDLIRIFAGDAGIEVRLDLRAGDASVRCHRAEIQQVLLNLVRNATDSLYLSDQPTGSLTIQTDCDTAMVSLRVIDNGQGVAPENEERIFDLWFSTKDSGLGIGLAYARRVANSRGGTLRLAENRPGNVVFELQLPIVI